MIKVHWMVFPLAAFVLSSACGEVTEAGGDADPDPDEGDADDGSTDAADRDADDGPTDAADGDAGVADPCEEPPTAVCGEPVDETCPPREPDFADEVFPDLDTLGLLLPTEIAGGDAEFGASLAAATSPALGGGHGTALALAMRRDGEVDRPKRIDVPLDDFLAAEPGELPTDEGDLAEEGEVSSVSAGRLNIDDARIGFIMGDREGEQTWRGDANFVTQETQIDNEDIGDLWDAVAAGGRFHYVRFEDEDDGPTLRGNDASISPPVSATGTTDEVPDEEDLRTRVSDSGVLMFQDLGERFWFWNRNEAGLAVESSSIGGADGKAAWVEGSVEYLLAYHEEGTIVFRRYECPDGEGEQACVPAPIAGDPASVSTNAPSGAAPSGLRLPNDRVAVLITEHHDEGDRLVLQLVESDLQNVGVPRIEIVDYRDEGLRVTDAELDLVQTDDASTLAVTMAVGPERGGADRVMMTGVRACEE